MVTMEHFIQNLDEDDFEEVEERETTAIQHTGSSFAYT